MTDGIEVYIRRLKQTKQLGTVAGVGEAVYYMADHMEQKEREMRQELAELRDDLRATLALVQQINSRLDGYVKDSERSFDRLWKLISNSNGNESGSTQKVLLRLMTQALVVGFLSLLMVSILASPEGAGLLRLLIGSGE